MASDEDVVMDLMDTTMHSFKNSASLSQNTNKFRMPFQKGGFGGKMDFSTLNEVSHGNVLVRDSSEDQKSLMPKSLNSKTEEYSES